ncbi:hypothetical protein GUITHDRAFT_148856 [Guillardia theta CCMP2712]|uniref:Uncharacterized protein n=2 Tax=Guillardia theta TaxID=55529 RepID=L1I750_GUITC|nr:hypothetical protein GUITHDRAFT_148856 [Guillardia theta CCMP2712]EKX32083.1 hypothetical protein GUITHDRAFT_148856 [Guillardia theta CCMP2712]|eukprot:XP_005819063.1 hypothetical protein GUITHDRAFT_148856 [Guillardia theta CCMP2712]
MVSSPKRMLLLKASAFFLFLSWLCSASSTSTPQRLLVGVAELPPRISSAPGHRTLSTLNLRGGNSDDDDDSGKSDKQSEIFEEEEEGGEEGDEESLITMLKNFTLDIPAEILDTQSNSTRDLVSDFEQRINDLVPRWPKKRLNRTLGRLADLFSDHLPTVYNYALALYEYGDYQRAEIYFTKALNLPRREEW